MKNKIVRAQHVYNHTKIVTFPLLVVSLASLFTSCRLTQAPVLTTLGSSIETVKKRSHNVPFTQTLSHAAAAPFTDVGNIWRYQPGAGYSRAIGVTDCASFVQRTEMSGNYCPQELADLQADLLKLQQLGASRVSLRFQKELLPRARRYAKIKKMGDSHDPMNVNPEAAALQAEYNEVLKQYNTAFDKVVTALNKPGIIAMRWNSQSETNFTATVTDIASLGLSRGRSFGGTVIAAGLRQSILHVGPDIHQLGHENIPTNRLANMKVATFTLQAENVMWVKDMTLESVFGAGFRFDPRNVQAINAAEIEMKITQASIASLSAIGHMSKPVRKVERIDWSTQAGISRIDNSDGWLTILMVHSSIPNLQKMVLVPQ